MLKRLAFALIFVSVTFAVVEFIAMHAPFTCNTFQASSMFKKLLPMHEFDTVRDVIAKMKLPDDGIRDELLKR
jgi:hypothetical protein